MLAKPKKSLGQNFLHDKNIINKIIDASNINFKDEVLEIGPGTGNLTEFIISQNPKKIDVIERDENLAKILEKKFLDKINIVTKDILSIPFEFYSKRKFKILGNLPYNISTKILSTWCLNNNLSVSKMILMFQKEVAERIVAQVHTNEDPKNLEKITKVFFNQRRKMIKKPINILFKDFQFDYKKLDIKPSDRPQNLNLEKYLGIVNEYETLRS